MTRSSYVEPPPPPPPPPRLLRGTPRCSCGGGARRAGSTMRQAHAYRHVIVAATHLRRRIHGETARYPQHLRRLLLPVSRCRYAHVRVCARGRPQDRLELRHGLRELGCTPPRTRRVSVRGPTPQQQTDAKHKTARQSQPRHALSTRAAVACRASRPTTSGLNRTLIEASSRSSHRSRSSSASIATWHRWRFRFSRDTILSSSRIWAARRHTHTRQGRPRNAATRTPFVQPAQAPSTPSSACRAAPSSRPARGARAVT